MLGFPANRGALSISYRQNWRSAAKQRGKKAFDESRGRQLSGTENKLNPSIPAGEDVRRELAVRRGDEVRHREEVARLQKTIDRLREELAVKSVSAAAEINRRDGRIEELQKAYAHIDQLLKGEQVQRNQLFAELERVRREFWEELNAARQQAEAARQQAEAAHQQAEAAHQQAEAARQQAEAARRQTEVDRRQFERDQQEITELRQRFDQSNQLLQKTSVRLADFETRNAALSERLRKQLLEMKRLLRLLDQIDDAANLLRRSRRWKIANPFASLIAILSGKPLPGFGHLDKNVEKYRAWRSNHPETADLEREIQELRPREIVSQPALPSNQPTTPAEPAAPTRPIKFAQQPQPEVSIIIPVFNQSRFTLACLAAVQENTGGLAYEVIVVDDHSTDNTYEIIGGIPGLVYVRAEANAGFIASCNRGAEEARGKFLVFLNNDTTVTEGWLSALRETFEFEPNAGLVGSKLVYPDGRLQEAGGIIWRDGSGWNRGKFQDPTKPEFNYLREVDYCSAASLMIPAELLRISAASTRSTLQPITRIQISPSRSARVDGKSFTSHLASCFIMKVSPAAPTPRQAQNNIRKSIEQPSPLLGAPCWRTSLKTGTWFPTKAPNQEKSVSLSSIIISRCPIAIPDRCACSKFSRFCASSDIMSLSFRITSRISLPMGMSYANAESKSSTILILKVSATTCNMRAQHWMLSS